MVFTNTLYTYTHTYSAKAHDTSTQLRLRFVGVSQFHELPNFLPRIYYFLHKLFPQHPVGTAEDSKKQWTAGISILLPAQIASGNKC